MSGKQAKSALESDPGTVNDTVDPNNDVSEIDPDIALSMGFEENRYNSEQEISVVDEAAIEIADSLNDDFSLAPEGTGEVQPAVPPGAAPAAQNPAPVTTPAVEAQAPAGQQPTAAQQPQVAPTPAVAQPAAPAAAEATPAQQPAVNPSDTFRVLHQTIEQQQPQIEKMVADQAYQLTAAELEQISTEPEKVLPALMARVHVNAVKGALRHIAQQLPTVVNAMNQARDTNRSLEDQFYAKWPQLDRNADGMKVRQAAAMYRQMNPQASLEDMIQNVGATVVVALGKHVAPAAQPQGRPAAPPVRRAVPFVPAAPASAAPANGAHGGGQVDGWEKTAMVMIADQGGAFE